MNILDYFMGKPVGRMSLSGKDNLNRHTFIVKDFSILARSLKMRFALL